MTPYLRKATTDDEGTVRDLQAEAIAWLGAKGTEQWQPDAMRVRLRTRSEERGLSAAITRGEVWMVELNGDSVGTFTLDEYADPEFWLETDEPGEALYIHRMVVKREAAGLDLGGKILDWATAKAAAQDKRWLRLDAWRTNEGLHRYYLHHRFQLVRIVALEHRGSGALFQRAVLY